MKDGVLEKILDFDRERDLPLHAQVRRVLARVAADHFEEGERFFSEPVLIDKLKVSQGTVRRALSDLVREGMLFREPAKGTFVQRKSRTRKLGIFIPLHESSFLISYLDRLSRGAREKGWKMEVFPFRQDEGGKGPLEHVSWGPQEGDILLVCCPSPFSWQFHDILTGAGYRVICIDSPFEGEMVGAGVDDAAGIRIGLSHLVELGHRRIAFLLNESLDLKPAATRRDTFQNLAPTLGIEYAPIFDCGTKLWENSFEKSYEVICRNGAWINGEVTAVFACSDPGAWALLRYCAEQKIDVPGRLSVIGFDNEAASGVVCPPLTAVDHPSARIVETAFRMLESSPSESGYCLISPGLTRRASTGPVSRS